MKTKLVLLLIGAALLSGCGTFGQKKTNEQIVAERGQEWMDALIKKDFKKAWGYTTPGFRKSNDVFAFKRKYAGALSWTGGRFKSTECEEDRCTAAFDIDYSLPRFDLKNTRPINSVWIKVDGKWWLYVK